MPRSPQWMDLYQIWFRESSRGRNQMCGILLQSAHGFRFCEGSKFSISHWLGRSPLTQCSLWLKAWKDPRDPSSYRPISMTPAVCKLMEKLYQQPTCLVSWKTPFTQFRGGFSLGGIAPFAPRWPQAWQLLNSDQSAASYIGITSGFTHLYDQWEISCFQSVRFFSFNFDFIAVIDMSFWVSHCGNMT